MLRSCCPWGHVLLEVPAWQTDVCMGRASFARDWATRGKPGWRREGWPQPWLSFCSAGLPCLSPIAAVSHGIPCHKEVWGGKVTVILDFMQSYYDRLKELAAEAGGPSLQTGHRAAAAGITGPMGGSNQGPWTSAHRSVLHVHALPAKMKPSFCMVMATCPSSL